MQNISAVIGARLRKSGWAWALTVSALGACSLVAQEPAPGAAQEDSVKTEAARQETGQLDKTPRQNAKGSGKAAGSESAKATPSSETSPKEAPDLEPPQGAKRLSPKYKIWIDTKKKQVLIDGEVCLRKGPLEMFACPRGSKEHESVVSLDTKAFLVHAGLLTVGAKVGGTVQFDPRYKPAHGSEIDIRVRWIDQKGKQREARAQQWVRNGATHKELEHSWVFAGSGFWTDEQTGKRYYEAEAGDLICVSNFPSATLDLPIESSQANEGLLFEAYTERIPPLGTKVRLVLTPKADKPSNEKEGDAKKDAKEGGKKNAR